MIDNPFRSLLPAYSRTLIQTYQALNLSPNFVTILGCVVGILSSVVTSQRFFLLGLGLWWLSRLFDGTDGIYARHIQNSTKFGAFLDINCDMLAYSSMILAFSCVWPEMFYFWLTTLALYILCISGALSLGSLRGKMKNNKDRKLSLAAGLAEGGETGLYYSLILLLPAYVYQLTISWIGLLCLTVIARTLLAYQLLNNEKDES